jgi:hypothetical protein
MQNFNFSQVFTRKLTKNIIQIARYTVAFLALIFFNYNKNICMIDSPITPNTPHT